LLWIPTVIIGYFTINQIIYELYSQQLMSRLENLNMEITQSYNTLEKAGILELKEYVQGAQDALLEKFDRYRFGETGRIYIINQQGETIHHTSSSSENMLPSSVNYRISMQSSGDLYFNINNEGYFGVFSKSTHWGWAVILVVKEEEIFSSREDYLVTVLTIGLVVVFIVFFASFVFTRKYSSKIILTLDTLARMAAGDHSIRFPESSSDEIGVIQHSVNALITQVERQYDELRLGMTVFETASEAIFVTDVTNQIVTVNPAFTKFTGYSRSEMLGENPKILESGHHDKAFYDEMWQTLESKYNWQGETWNQRKDGSVFPVWLSLSVLRSSDGDVTNYVAVFSDITERKMAEKEQKRLQRELQQAQKMEALGQLTGGIAHDFNNLLGIIIGNTELVQGNALPETLSEKQTRYLKNIQQAAERAAKLVAQMLTFSRSGEVKDDTLQLSPLIREDIKMLRSSLPASIEINTEIQQDLPSVLIDPIQLNQIIMNLAVNARDAMEGKGLLTVRLGWSKGLDTECPACHKQVTGDWIEFFVSDTGTGIDPKIRPNIFDPFFTTKEVGKGTGLGMSVIHSIMHSHGGHILLETELGKGTTFRILFPPVPENANKNLELTTGTEEVSRGQEQHILILDDEPDLASYLSNLLESYGYQVTVRMDSEEVLNLFNEDPDAYDLLITDQTMPGMTGMDLVKAVREIRPDFPVILVTGFSDQVDEEKAAKMNIGFLGKPVDSNHLMKVINMQLGR